MVIRCTVHSAAHIVSDKPLFVKLCSGVRVNFKGKSPLAAMTCESTQPTRCNSPVRYICTSGHSTLRSIQLQEKIHDDQVTVLQKVKLHLRGRRAIWWRI